VAKDQTFFVHITVWHGVLPVFSAEMGDSHLFVDFSFQFEYSGGMPRQARVVIPGVPHPITQRGNNRRDVFFADGDRVRSEESEVRS